MSTLATILNTLVVILAVLLIALILVQPSKSGGGFGGISIHLVETAQAESYAERIKTAYKSQTGIDAATFICSIGDGAGVEG